MTCYFTIDSEDGSISFSVGYDEEKDYYYMPSVRFKSDVDEEYYDNPRYLYELYKTLKNKYKDDEYYEALVKTLKTLSIEHTKEFDLELLSILNLANRLNYLNLEL